MTLFQILMLGASAFFAYKIYEHIQTLQDPEETSNMDEKTPQRSVNSFSTSDATTLLEKADAKVVEGNLDMALAIYSEANIKEPNNDETLFKMGYVLAKQERDEEALEYFKEALALDDKNPFTHLEMAKVYSKDGEVASARTHLNAALELDPKFEQAQRALDKLNAEN